MRLKTFSRILLLLAAGLIAGTLFVPVWRIDLFAPQYPEGLVLLIHANGLGGNVDIINGLNHYIGMQELHTEDFIEFAILPYILGVFALLTVLVAILGRMRFLYILLGAFVLFGIVAMVDFWWWEYRYGHNLDPNAAIIVPGMAYQPPLIGYKQLLNFGAYSFPDFGGWFMLIAGLLMVGVIFFERRFSIARFRKPVAAGLMASVFLTGCVDTGPREIRINVDQCVFCKMAISDMRFGAQTITQKGRVYMFDDISCLIAYQKQFSDVPYAASYVADYLAPHQQVSLETATLIRADTIRSPMRGNIAVFGNQDSALVYRDRFDAELISWKQFQR